MEQVKKFILDISPDEMAIIFSDLGEPRHRTSQVLKWIYGKGVLDIEKMTDIPKNTRKRMRDLFSDKKVLCAERAVSRDGTEKFLWDMGNKTFVESVMIPEGSRRTVCVSTQDGCRFRCPFCASGARGFYRDLTFGEIIAQIMMTQNLIGERITNVVFMGMGEPFDNYENLIKAIRIINHHEGMSIAGRKITISTCGLVPGIEKVGKVGIQTELSVSLHAVNDTLRNKLVPANRKYPLGKLLPALKEHFTRTGRIVTLEYALIKGVNDSLKESEILSVIALDLKAKVNLIRCNPIQDPEFCPSEPGTIERFLSVLKRKKVKTTLRRSRGKDIEASCGQLAAGVERK